MRKMKTKMDYLSDLKLQTHKILTVWGDNAVILNYQSQHHWIEGQISYIPWNSALRSIRDHNAV